MTSLWNNIYVLRIKQWSSTCEDRERCSNRAWVGDDFDDLKVAILEESQLLQEPNSNLHNRGTQTYEEKQAANSQVAENGSEEAYNSGFQP